MIKEDIPIQCIKCGAPIEVDPNEEYATCAFCGASYLVADLLDESDELRIAKINHKTTVSKIRYERENRKRERVEERTQSFQRSWLSRIILLFAAMSAVFSVMALQNDSYISCGVGLVQAAILILCWLQGSQIIPEPIKNTHYIFLFVALVLVIPFFSFLQTTPVSEPEKLEWQNLYLSEVLPSPESVEQGKVNSDSSDRLYVDIYNQDRNMFKNYLKTCKEAGFQNDPVTENYEYSAYNEEGYRLSVHFFEREKEISVSLYAPIEMGEFIWPEEAAGIPQPNSKIGKVDYIYASSFRLYVGETNLEAYNSYVNEIIQVGFNKDNYRHDRDFSGDHSDGSSIDVEFMGNDTMMIEYRKSE